MVSEFAFERLFFQEKAHGHQLTVSFSLKTAGAGLFTMPGFGARI